MKRLVIGIALGLVMSGVGHATPPKPKMKSLTSSSQVRMEWMNTRETDVMDVLRRFVKAGKPSRLVGSKGHEAARAFIIEELQKYTSPDRGDSIRTDEFSPDVESAAAMYQNDFDQKIKGKIPANSPDYMKWQLFTLNAIQTVKTLASVKGQTVIWERKGSVSPDQVIVLAANYDSVVFDQKTMKIRLDAPTPGADNNGTGVAVLLQIAKQLNTLAIPKTIRLVFLDFEEFGFLGSKAYAQSLKDEMGKNPKLQIDGIVNVLMLGHDTVNLDKEKKKGNMKLYLRKPDVTGSLPDKALAERFSSIGAQVTSMVKFDLYPNSFDTSGAVSFWDAGFPSIVFSQNWETDYNERGHHTENDFVETINASTLYHSFLYIGAGLCSWLYDIKR